MKKGFQFNRSQKAAVITLATIIFVLIILLNQTTHQFIPDILLPENGMAIKDSVQLQNSKDSIQGFSKKEIVKLAYFDPNYASTKDWQHMGFSSKQAQSIIKYKRAIDGFKSKDDLEACFVISAQKFKEIAPFIIFRSKTDLLEKHDTSKVTQDLILIELNSANEKELIAIKGIGAVLANRIIAYRNSIGGFYQISQLKEVYGLSEENFEFMKKELRIDSSNIIKIDVMQLNFDQLHKHPYINWNMSKKIILWRESHHNISLIQSLKNDTSISQNEILRIKPYLP